MSGHLFGIESDAVATTSDDCYTPHWVFAAMGLRFDLDVAAPVGGAPLVPATRHYSAQDDGLASPWSGVVWCNPPYSRVTPWARAWAAHPAGAFMATYAPETYWFPLIVRASDAVAFISCKFSRPNAGPIKPRHGVFVAFRGVGIEPAERLAASDRFGSVLYGKSPRRCEEPSVDGKPIPRWLRERDTWNPSEETQ